MGMSRLSEALFISFLLSALTLGPLFRGGEEVGAAELPGAQIRNHLKQGIGKVFDMDDKAGIAELMKAVELDRESPTGYAFLTLAYLFFYEMSFDEKERERNQESMVHFVGEALSKGEKRVEKDPKDGQAFFAMGLAKLAKIRWNITRKRYFAVAQESQNIRDYLERAKDLDPENYDIYFPMGLLRYHLDHLPGFTRFLSSLLSTSGDRQKGLQELELAAKRGHLLKELAQVELSSAYSNFEKQPGRALPLARELKEKFPHNYNFLFSLANTLSDLGRQEEALSAAQEIENGIKSGSPPFRPELWPRYYQLMGKINLDKKEYARATEFFKRAVQDASPYNARVRVWALVRLGMIHDIHKERKLAEEYYRRALDVEGGEGLAQITAKQYLKSPYSHSPIK